MRTTYKTPEDAEAAFYDAIERGDIDALENVWSNDDNVVCIHPGATRIEGRQAVMESFVQLFSEAPMLSFSLVDTLYTGNDCLAVHLVREEIALDGQVVSIMASTNIFQMEDGGWRMLLHHASPEPDMGEYDELDISGSFDSDDTGEWVEPARPFVLH